MKLFTGSVGGAAKDILARGAASVNGNTELVRNHMARLLMEGDPEKIQAMLMRLGSEDARRERFSARTRERLTRGVAPAVNAGQGEQSRGGKLAR